MPEKLKIMHLVKIVFLLCAVFRLSEVESKQIEESKIKKSFQSAAFRILNILPGKIFTPNNDNWNDYFEIQYVNPKDAFVSAVVYDLNGMVVTEMKNDDIKETLIWEGEDSEGNPMPSGMYIYQIGITGIENTVINGIVILAR